MLLVGCVGESGVEYDCRSIASLWSCVKGSTTLITEDIYLSGYVVANDKFGELNKTIVVADDSGGVAIDIDMEDIDLHYPLYSKVVIRCAGLWLGRVGPKLILGAEPTANLVVDRISFSEVGNYLSSLPYNDNTPSLRQHKVAELGYRDMLRRISLSDLHIIDEERGSQWADLDTVTGRFRTSIRHFCQDGDTLRVVVDGNCRYANEDIPSTNLRLSGILDWYNGSLALRIINHSIYL